MQFILTREKIVGIKIWLTFYFKFSKKNNPEFLIYLLNQKLNIN
jgi:hypothetical protein